MKSLKMASAERRGQINHRSVLEKFKRGLWQSPEGKCKALNGQPQSAEERAFSLCALRSALCGRPPTKGLLACKEFWSSLFVLHSALCALQ